MAKRQFTSPITIEQGIRQTGPQKWEVRVFAGRHPDTGKTRHISRTVTTSLKDAKVVKASLITEIDQGKHGVSGKGTFGELLDRWLKDGRSGRAETTLHAYRQTIEASIRPALGSIPLDKLSAIQIDGFYNRMLEKGTSPARVMQYHRIISAALSQGEKWDMVQRNEAKRVNVPKVPRKEQNTPPPERVRALIEAAAVSGTPEMATIITLAALTGMRRGELCGLQWCDINWEESSLTVRHAIWETSGGKAGIKDPKSHQIRHIDLSVHAMAVLTGRWQRVVGAANVAEIELTEDAFVLSPQVDGLKWMRPGNITLAFGRLCKRMEEAAGEDADEAGRKLQPSELWAYRFHDLRRYTATELFRAGHNARTVSDRLGHSEPGFTLRVYTGGTSDQSKAAAAALDIGLTG